MAQTEKKISARQLFLFIIQAQIGVGVLSIPYKLNETARGGAGITVLITGAITQLIILMFWLLLRKFPGLNLFQICLRLGGRVFGKLLIAGYIGYFVLLGANIMLSAVGVLQRWMIECNADMDIAWVVFDHDVLLGEGEADGDGPFLYLVVRLVYPADHLRKLWIDPSPPGIYVSADGSGHLEHFEGDEGHDDLHVRIRGDSDHISVNRCFGQKEADDHKHVEFVRHVVLCFRGQHLSHGVQLRAASLDSRARSLSGQIAEFLHRRPGGRLVPSHLVDHPRLLDHELCVCRFRGACAIVQTKKPWSVHALR